jgi:predicted ribosome quality control (RQC) complex YloA/Tae2 family protein
MVYPMPSVQFPADQQHARASVDEALDAMFRSLVTRSALEDERSQTLTAIRRASATRQQALKSIARTLAESTKADRYKQIGELILANLPSIERGAKSATLVDYYDSEMPEVEVELDEKLGANENAQRYFKRYQKARDAVATAEARRTRITRQLAVLAAAGSEAESAKGVETVLAVRKMLVDQDMLRAEIVQEKGAGEAEFPGFRIRRFYTPEGWEILYGENSTSNDHLTQKVARPNDVWLHARSIAGAHVIIRTAGQKATVPTPVLAQAARIAARNSDARHSSLVPVDHTLRKFVRKPRGSAPGLVTYRNEKTVDINPAD